ncbi:MAG: hypothetical protein GEU95_21500 [Rhizobiales bacterium]|nr:hypothetical protein [Hyphomicrobiales bacterium]
MYSRPPSGRTIILPTKIGRVSVLKIIAAFVAVVCLQTASAKAQDFFAGKTVTLVVGYQAGSLYDTNARFVARHLARFIPGKPTVIVRNMPGAGTLTAANNVANLAPKDGTTIGLIARGMSIEPLLGGQGVRFEPLALNWIGSTSREVSVIAVRTDTGVKSLDDVKTREVVVAGPALGTDGVTFPTTLNNLLGTRFKVVTGYRSGAEMTLAVERKEVDGRGSWSWASFRNDGMTMLKRGELVLLVQMATAKSPDIPQVPLVMDYAKTDEQRQVLGLLLAGQAMAWPVFAPAEVPADRVALLRQSYLAMLKDPETLADAKRLGIDVDPVSGEGYQRDAQTHLRDPAGRDRAGTRSRGTQMTSRLRSPRSAPSRLQSGGRGAAALRRKEGDDLLHVALGDREQNGIRYSV